LKKGRKKKRKEGNFNTGRWMPEEHQRFIEALLKFGNDWKNVQRYVGSRSSTQARSHAQKFFVKIGKTQIENLSLDFENNSLKSLNLMANNLNQEQMSNAIKYLNEMAFEKKTLGRRQMNTENFVDFNFNENSFDMENMIIEFNYNKFPLYSDKVYENFVPLKNKTLTGIKRYIN
jgi:SHAQKYF class myb-like DNA-binding protein